MKENNKIFLIDHPQSSDMRRLHPRQQNRRASLSFRKNFRRLVLVAGIGILSSSCAIPSGVTSINDITFKDIGPVDRNEVIYSFIERKFLERNVDALRLRFTSREILTTLKYPTDGFYANISLCPYNPNQHISVARVLYQGRDLGDFRGGAPDPRPDKNDGRYVYEIFFRYPGQVQFNSNIHSFGQSSLPEKPTDICFRLEGPRVPHPVSSNVAIIPAEHLSNALVQLRAQ